MRYDWILRPHPETALLSRVNGWEQELAAAGHIRSPINGPILPDVLVSVGGDGTLLHAARVAAPHRIPVVGINQGHLGFLTSLTAEQASEALLRLFQDPPIPEVRLVLQATLHDSKEQVVASGLAVNDVVMRSADHLMTLSWGVDGKTAAVWRADGVIVSTPTGSTAYNLSAGGAILEPELEAMTITPLCPQTLSHRPMVVSAKRQLSLVHESVSAQRCALDGQDVWWVQPGHRLVIERSAFSLQLWRLPTDNFYSTLRQKLGWNAVDNAGFPLQTPGVVSPF